MHYEEIHKYLNDHAPDGVEFSYPDDRDYWCAEYNGKAAWAYIPQDITIEELDSAIKGCIKYFNIGTVPPVGGVLVE